MKRLLRLSMPMVIGALACLAVPGPALADEGPKKTADAPDRDQQLLQSVGTLAGAQLYHAFLNIGLIADGKTAGVYKEDDAKQILTSVGGLIGTLDDVLEKAGKLELKKEDRASLAEMKRLSGLLKVQVEELQAFWKTGKKEQGAKYEKARKEAWEGISKLLNLKE